MEKRNFIKNFANSIINKSDAKKFAFTLVEMLMALLIVSVVLSASLPVISQRTKAQSINYSKYGAVPIGIIAIWGSAKPLPDNTWLECNGQAIPSGIEYEEIRKIYGTNLPDYRGVFLRGVGGNAASIGILQSDEIKSHTHAMQNAGIHNHQQGNEGLYNFFGGGVWAGSRSWAVGGYNAYQLANTSTTGEHAHIINVTGGSETRPVNKAVRYIIKVRR